MIENFESTMRPLVAEITHSIGENRIGEPIFAKNLKNFEGVIFTPSARDFALQNDIAGVTITHILYSKGNFGKKDTIIDNNKKYEVIASLEVRDWNGQIDHYKTLLVEIF